MGYEVFVYNSHLHPYQEKTWNAMIDDSNWSQQNFPYQDKCLRWINDEYQKLNDEEKTKVSNFLDKTHCINLIRR